MGLSRNKVAVSEGAAGSPPFYGERVKDRKSPLRSLKEKKNNDFDEYLKKDYVVQYSRSKALISQCYKRRGSTCTHSEHRS